MKYRKKPVVVEAIQWNGENIEEVKDFAGKLLLCDIVYQFDYTTKYDLQIKTLEGNMRVHEGDYIIKGVEGEFYPCKPSIFEKTYELVGYNSETIESHGKWLPDYETFVDENGYESEPIQTGFFCSACGALGCKEDSYCKCCGSKMDKVGDNE